MTPSGPPADPHSAARPAADPAVVAPQVTALHRASVAFRVLAGVVMVAALAAMFVPSHPDPLVVIYFAAPSLALASVSNHLDGRHPLTGNPRRGRSQGSP